MNSKTNDICAFPCTKVSETEMRVNGDGRSEARTDYEISGGMSLRDYFAAKMMQGIMSNSEVERKAVDSSMSGEKWKMTVVKTAYAYADAMLAEREK